jgi:DHA1 family solute carrier family 18 vesicular amine transporter 1/2
VVDAPAPASIKRPAMALTVALAFSQDALYGLVFLSYMNHYLLDVLNTSPALPGYTLALYGGVKLAIHPLAGRLLDRHSPRSLFRAAVLVQAAGLVLVLLVHALWSFLAATCLIAAGSAAIWPLLYETIARTQLVQVHSRVTGIVTFAGDIATGIGLAIGVVAGNFGPWRSAFYVALAIAVLPILGQQMSALDRSPPEHAHAPAPRPEADRHGGVHKPHLAVGGFRDRIQGAAFFALVVFIDYAAVSSLGGVYGAYVRRSLNITLLRTAVLLIPAAAAAGLALLVASRFSRPERRMLELAALFVVSAGGALGLAVAPTAYAAAGAAVFLAAGAGGAGPIIAAAMIEQSGGPSDRGLVIGTLMSIEGLGAVVGPGVTAAVISASGARASLAFIGAVFVLLVPLSYAAWRSSRIAASPDPAQASI